MRRLAVLLALALLVVACDSAAEDTTTTAPDEDTTTTTAPPPTAGRQPLTPNGDPVVSQGDSGALVEALQFYLVCVGLEQPDPEGPQVTVDGSYGPITAFAVAYFQAQVGRAPSGSPDDETFGLMSRECQEPRTLEFPVGEASVEIAGNVAPGDSEVFTFDGSAGQVLHLAASTDDIVEIAIRPSGGEALAEGAMTAEAELGAAQAYEVEVSAASPTTYVITASMRSPNVLVSDFGPMELRSTGVGVSDFGGDADNAVGVMGLILGTPQSDTDWQSDIAACPGSHRAVSWLIQAGMGTDNHPAVFVAYFSDDDAEEFVGYRYITLDLVALDPLVQGLATAGGVSLGTTLEQFSDAYDDATVDGQGTVTVDDGVVITFAIVGDDGPDEQASRVTRIEGGDGCTNLTD